MAHQLTQHTDVYDIILYNTKYTTENRARKFSTKENSEANSNKWIRKIANST